MHGADSVHGNALARWPVLPQCALAPQVMFASWPGIGLGGMQYCGVAYTVRSLSAACAAARCAIETRMHEAVGEFVFRPTARLADLEAILVRDPWPVSSDRSIEELAGHLPRLAFGGVGCIILAVLICDGCSCVLAKAGGCNQGGGRYIQVWRQKRIHHAALCKF